MKIRLLALLTIAAIPLMGFDCIVDQFTIALNLRPFNGTYTLNTGSSTNYAGSFAISPGTLYDNSYELTGASLYDIRVSTQGASLGTVTGSVSVNGVLLFTYGVARSATWNDFLTPQSLLSSPFIARNSAGVTTLVNAIVNNQQVTFAVAGTVGTPPATSTSNSITIFAYVRAYGHLK